MPLGAINIPRFDPDAYKPQPSGYDRMMGYLQTIQGLQKQQMEMKAERMKMSRAMEEERARRELATFANTPQPFSVPSIPNLGGAFPGSAAVGLPPVTGSALPDQTALLDKSMRLAAGSGNLDAYMKAMETMNQHRALQAQKASESSQKTQQEQIRNSLKAAGLPASKIRSLQQSGMLPQVFDEATLAAMEQGEKPQVQSLPGGTHVAVLVGGKAHVVDLRMNPQQVIGTMMQNDPSMTMEKAIGIVQSIQPAGLPQFINQPGQQPGWANPRTQTFTPEPGVAPREIPEKSYPIFEERQDDGSTKKFYNTPGGPVPVMLPAPGGMPMPGRPLGAPSTPSAGYSDVPDLSGVQPGNLPAGAKASLDYEPPPGAAGTTLFDESRKGWLHDGMGGQSLAEPAPAGAPRQMGDAPKAPSPTPSWRNTPYEKWFDRAKTFKNNDPFAKSYLNVRSNFDQAIQAANAILEGDGDTFGHNYQVLTQAIQKIVLPDQALRKFNVDLYQEGTPYATRFDQWANEHLRTGQPYLPEQLKEIIEVISRNAYDMDKLYGDMKKSFIGAIPKGNRLTDAERRQLEDYLDIPLVSERPGAVLPEGMPPLREAPTATTTAPVESADDFVNRVLKRGKR